MLALQAWRQAVQLVHALVETLLHATHLPLLQLLMLRVWGLLLLA